MLLSYAPRWDEAIVPSCFIEELDRQVIGDRMKLEIARPNLHCSYLLGLRSNVEKRLREAQQRIVGLATHFEPALVEKVTQPESDARTNLLPDRHICNSR